MTSHVNDLVNTFANAIIAGSLTIAGGAIAYAVSSPSHSSTAALLGGVLGGGVLGAGIGIYAIRKLDSPTPANQ